jgi:hypothetical protein
MPSPQDFHQIWLFPDRVCGAIAHSPFPDNARAMSVLQVIAIDFGKFMCFCANVNLIILYL